MTDFETDFWGNCANTYGEETKQLQYMKLMGFPFVPTWRTSFAFDMGGRSVIDIGGGPVSVLLKCDGLSADPIRRSTVIDPIHCPLWVSNRYHSAGINFVPLKGEELQGFEGTGGLWDLALIYNVLQHVEDPEKVVANAKAIAKELAMFEWIDLPPHEGHPHMLTEADLNRWTGKKGNVVELRGESACTGRAWVLPIAPKLTAGRRPSRLVVDQG